MRPNLARHLPIAARFRANVARFRPISVRFRPNMARTRQNQTGPILARSWPTSDQLLPGCDGCECIWPEFAECWLGFGRGWSEIGVIRSGFDQVATIWAEFDQFCAISTEFGWHLRASIEAEPASWHDFAQIWLGFDQVWAASAEFGSICAFVRPMLANFARLRLSLTRFRVNIGAVFPGDFGVT